MNIDSGMRQDALSATASSRLAEAASAAVMRLPVGGLRGPSRGRRPVAQARQQAMYLSHVVFGLSLNRVGICFGRDRTTVRHACHILEEGRDDPAQELALTALETGLMALARSIDAQVRS
jgi:chromosomal replication initiation ATPase DnaA